MLDPPQAWSSAAVGMLGCGGEGMALDGSGRGVVVDAEEMGPGDFVEVGEFMEGGKRERRHGPSNRPIQRRGAPAGSDFGPFSSLLAFCGGAPQGPGSAASYVYARGRESGRAGVAADASAECNSGQRGNAAGPDSGALASVVRDALFSPIRGR